MDCCLSRTSHLFYHLRTPRTRTSTMCAAAYRRCVDSVNVGGHIVRRIANSVVTAALSVVQNARRHGVLSRGHRMDGLTYRRCLSASASCLWRGAPSPALRITALHCGTAPPSAANGIGSIMEQAYADGGGVNINGEHPPVRAASSWRHGASAPSRAPPASRTAQHKSKKSSKKK